MPFGCQGKMEIIRKYKKSDWVHVCDIYDLSKPDEMNGIVGANQIIPLSRDEKMIQYFYESKVWVYEKDDHLLGFIGLKGDFISWLFVHPENRRRGIARQLLSKLIKENNNCLMLSIVKSNQAAMSLYLDSGFKVFEEFDGKMYGYNIPAIRMKRNKGAEPFVSPDR